MTRAAPVGSLPVNATHPLTRAQWRSWLARYHGRKEGVWLVLWKKASGKAQLDYDAAVEEALCFGWIDSKPRALDAKRSILWLAPRKPRTGWSRPNKLRVERAIAAGRMTSTGLAKIEAARSDGSWTRLDAVEDLVVPPDLAQALAQRGGAPIRCVPAVGQARHSRMDREREAAGYT